MVINKKGAMALSQILILILGIIAISYAIGSSVKIVSGEETFIDPISGMPKPVLPFSNPPAATPALTSFGYNPAGVANDIKNFYELKNPLKGLTVNDKDFGDITNIRPNLGTEGAVSYTVRNAKGEIAEIPAEQFNNYLEKSGNLEVVDPRTGTIQDSFVKGGTAEPPPSPVKGPFGWTSSGGIFFGHLIQGVMWGATVAGIIMLIGSFLPEQYKPAANALAAASFGGIAAGKLTYGLFSKGGWWGADVGEKVTGWGPIAHPMRWSIGFGLVTAAIIFIMMYKSEKESQELISFECKPWDAPSGGKDCEKCNKQDLPCSEYQCRSIGQSCVLENPGTTESMCVWQHRDDVKPPEMRPWIDALLPDYSYVPDKTISPPDYGSKIVNKKNTDGCVPAFTPLSFGIETNEPSRCKIDYVRKQNFSDMGYYFGGSSLFRYNHTQVMSLPGPSSLASENLTIQNNGEFSLYTRCIDTNGNADTWTYVFRFCVDKASDETPPIIITTNLLNNMPIAYNQSSLDLEVYTNEPATCKWSHRDQDYDKMEETMSCSYSAREMNAQMLYTCAGTLTGLKNEIANDFYFRCKDKPTFEDKDRNVNSKSYKFTVLGTRPLVIKSASPNNKTIKDSTNSIKVTLEVETAAGYKEGQAECYYSDTGTSDSYVLFLETNSYTHKQELYLAEGSYTYYLKCIDLGGNPDEKVIKFSVDSDSEAPLAVRVFKEEGDLRLITSEEAKCVYDSVDCNYLFKDGTKMDANEEGTSHFTTWNTQSNFYIKCQDKFGNEPLPNQCSIVVRPFELHQGTTA